MTVAKLTQRLVNYAAPRGKRYDLRDTEVKGLFLRVEPSGKKTFYINYRTPRPARRQRNIKLAPGFTPLCEVRAAAKRFLSRLWLENSDPAWLRAPSVTVAELLKKYEPWVKKQRKSGKKTVRMIRQFGEFLPAPVSSLTSETISAWQKRQTKIKGATVNRRFAALRSMLSWAKRQELIPEVPFSVSKVSQKDSKVVERYLTPEEREKLLSAAEKCGTKWMKTAIILSLNTGIRKGTLLKLKWSNVDLENKQLKLEAAIMKGGKDAVLPLNDAACEELARWKKRTRKQKGLVFSVHGKRLSDTRTQFCKLLEQAGIKNFSWHCLRHDFASRLAMAGVSMHVVQKLMCHSTLQMTERYAHLAPSVLAEAVSVLE